MQGSVVIGFGSSRAKLTTKIIEENSRVIQRLNKKPTYSNPTIKATRLAPIDMEHFRNIISQRRNEALINSFLNISDQDDVTMLVQFQQQAKHKISAIDDELRTTQVVAADFKLHKFMSDTQTNEHKGKQYLLQFNNNVQKAVKKYRERDLIIRKFSEKNHLDYSQAENILKANGYNAGLFD